MDNRTIAALLRTLSASPRPVRCFSESTDPDGTTTTKVEFADGPGPAADDEDERPRPAEKSKIRDYELVSRKAPIFVPPPGGAQ